MAVPTARLSESRTKQGGKTEFVTIIKIGVVRECIYINYIYVYIYIYITVALQKSVPVL